MTLYEKYRPKELSEIVGQDKAVYQIRQVLRRGWGGRAWWIAGLSGTGKTTLARIIARAGAEDWFIEEHDSGDAMTTAEMDRIENAMHFIASGKGGRAFIINEAHGLRRDIIRRWLGVLERIPKHVCFVFTTTKLGQKGLFDAQIDAHPLLSRCTQLTLNDQGLIEVFADHCRQIANKENLNGKPRVEYIKLAQRCKSNCREMLMKIESGEML